MTNQELFPSIYAQTPAPTVSEKYQFIRTADVLESLENLGWNPREMKEVKARKSHTLGFQKHLIRLNNPKISEFSVGEEIPELIVTNSHNGRNSFSFRLGVYRLVCSNGLVIPVEEFSNLTIRHFGEVAEQVGEIVEKSIQNFPSIYSVIEKMKQKSLSPSQISSFAKQAAEIRTKELSQKLAVGADGILKVLREEDEGDKLWKIFNRAQENLLAGNFEVSHQKGNRKAMPIKSITKNISLNEGLWDLAKSYL